MISPALNSALPFTKTISILVLFACLLVCELVGFAMRWMNPENARQVLYH
jgi:hypothetical protein